MTIEDYDTAVAVVGGVCEICKNPPSGSRNGIPLSLCVDHDHATGAVRGLLCSNCNSAIGLLKDDPERIRRAAAYLEAHQP
jgi:hypothetical protein